MAIYSIDEALLNQQVQNQEMLSECLAKADALASVALGIDFLDYPATTIYDFLWALQDRVGQARALNEQALNRLLSTTSFKQIC